MALPITVGNWTFEAENNPTSSSQKTITLDVPNWADYSLSTRSAIPSETLETVDQAMYYTDITGTGFTPVAQLSVGRKNVRNIYGQSSIPAASRLPSVGGTRALEAYVKNYKAGNSVNGAELEFMLKAMSSFTVPTWAAVPKEVVQDFLLSYASLLIAAATDPAGYLVSLLRGDLDLTR